MSGNKIRDGFERETTPRAYLSDGHGAKNIEKDERTVSEVTAH